MTFFCDFSFSVADFRPFDLAFQDVFEDLLRGITCEWSDADNHFIGDYSDWKIVNHMIGLLSFEDLRSNVVRSSEKTMRFLVLAVYYELGKVEIGKDKLAKFINDNVILCYWNAYRFQVPMNDSHLMDRVDCKNEVGNINLGRFFFQVNFIFQQLLEASSAAIIQD